MNSVTRGVGGNTGSCLADRRGLGRAWERCGGMRDGRPKCLNGCGVYQRDGVTGLAMGTSVWLEPVLGRPDRCSEPQSRPV